MQEIERKFLVRGEYKSLAESVTHVVQGYLCRDAGRTVRVRIRGGKGYLTIKGKSSPDGLQRFEFEKEITLAEAESLLPLCLPGVVDKVRHLVSYGGHTFEVDEFGGDNAGLVVAEVELKATDEEFKKPPFLGEEVTGDPKYYNSYLAEHPCKQWETQAGVQGKH